MINLNPKIWGPHAWFFIDSIVIALPNNIDNKMQNELKHFFISLQSLLPCEKCRLHFSEYIKQTNIIEYDFSTKDNVIIWVNSLHNNVNLINNSKSISIDNMLQFYNDKYNIATKSSYYDIGFIIIYLLLVIYLIKCVIKSQLSGVL